MEVRLKGQPTPVTLVEVERDDDQAVIGTTNSGKRFVARRASLGEPLPARHPYRIYLHTNVLLRVLDPAFDEMEKFLLKLGDYGLTDDPDTIDVTLDSGEVTEVSRVQIRSILSAMPEDEREAVAAANGHSDEDLADEGE